MAANVKGIPKDAQVMACILKEMGVTDYEPRVINLMLEFAYRYITDVLDDAKVYSAHASKKDIDKQDIKLAVQCQMDHRFTTPPPRELLLEIARQKNSQPLPPIKSYSGLKLPHDRYCLFAPNYRLRSLRKTTAKPGLSRVGGIGSNANFSHVTQVTPRLSFTSKPVTVRQPGPADQTLTSMSKPILHVMSSGSSSQPSLSNTDLTFRINTDAGSSLITTQTAEGGSSLNSTLINGVPVVNNAGSSLITTQTTDGRSSLNSALINGVSILNNPLKRKMTEDNNQT